MGLRQGNLKLKGCCDLARPEQWDTVLEERVCAVKGALRSAYDVLVLEGRPRRLRGRTTAQAMMERANGRGGSTSIQLYRVWPTGPAIRVADPVYTLRV